MNRFLVTVLFLLGCEGSVSEGEVEASTEEQAATSTGSPILACRSATDVRVAAWKRAGVPVAEIERRRVLSMASCADASFDESAALYQGAVNVDLERLARQLISSTITPEKYHHRVRDRVRKARKAKRDPALRLAWLVGDTDKDLIPNSLDLCPTTPDFEPTDDRGCPRAPPALAYVPNAEVVQQLFTKMGAAGDPKCAGAPVPSTPSAALLRLTGNGPLTPPTSLGGSPQQTTYHLAHIIKLGRVSNQPPGCLLMYDVEIVSRSSSPLQQHAYQFRYRDSEATYSDATSLSFWPRPGATGQHAALLADLTANWTASIRVRAVNGNGQASGWSPAY